MLYSGAAWRGAISQNSIADERISAEGIRDFIVEVDGKFLIKP
jgi:hypothetical protein